MRLNDAGKMVQINWEELPNRFISMDLDEYVIMPNHIHGIVILRENVGASLVGAQNNIDNELISKRGLNTVPSGHNIKDDSNNNSNNDHSNNDHSQNEHSQNEHHINVQPDINRAGTRPAPTNIGLDDVIGSFKSITTNQYITGVRKLNWHPFYKRFWQRNYYDHIIRDENEINRVRRYIIENPLKWDMDVENPDKIDAN
jgi:REP element-mobilizing transposase RayT